MSDPIQVVVGDDSPPITVTVAPPAAVPDIEVTLAGDRGPPGDTGPANTLTIGTVTTAAAGASASATVTGTAPSQVLNLTLPRGDTGVKGDQGVAGPACSLTVGTVTTGAAGTKADATITGTAPNQVLSLTLPRGETGATGAVGETGLPGLAASVTVGATTTGAAGSSASVTNTGTTSAAVLNFVVPRGNTGETGPQGPPGAGVAVLGRVDEVADLPAANSVDANDAYVVDDTGNLHVSNGVDAWIDVGPFRGEQGPAGPAGPTGATGAVGPANTLTIGTVTTGATGTNAAATITGTAPNQTLSLTIPTGPAGPVGPPGPAGNGNATMSLTAPEDCTSAGVAGTLAVSSTHLYVAVAENLWKRIPLEVWGTCAAAASLQITVQPQNATVDDQTGGGVTYTFTSSWNGTAASSSNGFGGAGATMQTGAAGQRVRLLSSSQVGRVFEESLTGSWALRNPTNASQNDAYTQPYHHAAQAANAAWFTMPEWRRRYLYWQGDTAAASTPYDILRATRVALAQQNSSGATHEVVFDELSSPIHQHYPAFKTPGVQQSPAYATGANDIAASSQVVVLALAHTGSTLNYSGEYELSGLPVASAFPLCYAVLANGGLSQGAWAFPQIGAAGEIYVFDHVQWSGSKFVAIGRQAITGGLLRTVCATSTNGVAWTITNVDAANSSGQNGHFFPLDVAYNGSRWLLVGGQLPQNDYDYSPSQVNWILNGTRVCYTSDNDGASWTRRELSLPAIAQWRSVEYFSTTGEFIAFTNGESYFAASVDGVTWRLEFMDSPGGWPATYVAVPTAVSALFLASSTLTRRMDGTGSTPFASFSVAATSPSAISYQWQRSNDGGGSWVDLAATTATLTVQPVSASDDGARFRCRLTSGGAVVTSQSATLTVT